MGAVRRKDLCCTLTSKLSWQVSIYFSAEIMKLLLLPNFSIRSLDLCLSTVETCGWKKKWRRMFLTICPKYVSSEPKASNLQILISWFNETTNKRKTLRTQMLPLYIGAGGAAATLRILVAGMLLVPALLLPTAAVIGCSRWPSSFSFSAVSSRCCLCLRMRSLSFSSLSSGWCRLRFSNRWEAEPGLVEGVLSPRRMVPGADATNGLDSWLSMPGCALGVLSSLGPSAAGTRTLVRCDCCPSALRVSRAGWSLR